MRRSTSEVRHIDPSTRTPSSPAKHLTNLALILVAIIALFWRVFFLGETLIDVNTLNNQLPWGYSSGQSDHQYNRRDLTDTYVTREYFVAASYRDGEFPLWNPYTMAGHPIYADGVTRTLSPFLLFYKFFDVPLGYSLARLFELMLAAVFMYIFLIAIGASANGGLMGALVFGLSAHSMLHLTGLGWWGGLMWLPLILLVCRSGDQTRELRPGDAGRCFPGDRSSSAGTYPIRFTMLALLSCTTCSLQTLSVAELTGGRLRRLIAMTVVTACRWAGALGDSMGPVA